MAWSSYFQDNDVKTRVWVEKNVAPMASKGMSNGGAGRRGSTPAYWNSGFSTNEDIPLQMTGTPNYRPLEPIIEDMDTSFANRHYMNGAVIGFPPNGFNSRQDSPSSLTNNRRHSEGDLLELASAGPRFNKKTPTANGGRQISRQTSSDGTRSPRKKSLGGTDSTGDFDAFSEVSTKSRYSVGSEDSLSSAAHLASRRKSESSVAPMSKTSSTVSLVQNEQRRKSSAGTPSVVSSGRRSSVANGLDMSKPVKDRRASVLSLGGAGAADSPFTNIEIPTDLLETSHSKFRKLLTPIILSVIVSVIVAGLIAAIYFAVVLKDSQDKQIEYLQASLQLKIAQDKLQRKLNQLSSTQLESLKTSCCKEVDSIYTAPYGDRYRGCEVPTLQEDSIGFYLYFLDKNLTKETIVEIFVTKSTFGSQLVEINGFALNISKDSMFISSEVVKKAENFIGANSPEIQPVVTPAPVVVSSSVEPPISGSQQMSTVGATSEWTTTTSTTTTTTITTITASKVTVTEAPTTSKSTLATIETSTSPTPVAANQQVVSATTSESTTIAATTTEPSTVTIPTVTTTLPTTATSTSPTSKATTGNYTSLTMTPQDLNKLCQNDTQETPQANPSSCTDFIQCEFGQAVIQPCPSGLVFNKSMSVCTLPESGACSPQPCVNLNGWYYPSETNCSQYIICEFGKAVKKSCGGTLVWDNQVRACVIRSETFQCPVSNGVITL